MIVEVICHANICRSPVAAALLEQTSGLHVKSSGLHAVPNQPADRRMIEFLGGELSSLLGHRSSRFSDRKHPTADLVLVMERSQKRHVLELVPHLTGRTMLFGQWLEGEPDIADPFGRSDADYEFTIGLLRVAASTWLERLSGME
ncbi:hypothetical protein [Tabrizicola sp.]|uniref:arsenate reductase/protein-tyrosine-phosphatase family protein n=1 Tax=Tabrizicola sp. TaxID=2005166 RepID=UPI002732E140|nr:hypothetical protein [Tabrizicola sp.]MDP3196191.1 hypothetical protein [Tabrizicola sp.]MDZ4068541.1 hypothetical protein [Tabrizicola sp.]